MPIPGAMVPSMEARRSFRRAGQTRGEGYRAWTLAARECVRMLRALRNQEAHGLNIGKVVSIRSR